jgi:nucleoside phosphorylase
MSKPSPPRNRSGFKVAIICALPLEADYVQSTFDRCWDDEGKQYGKALGDKNAYTTGVIGEHNVVLVHMPNMGSVSASAVAANVAASFPAIQLGLVVGICGAVPIHAKTKEEIVLGDIIISTTVIQYDFGRRYPDGFERKKEIEDSLGRANREIRAVAAKLETRQSRKRLENQLRHHLSNLQGQASEAKYPGVAQDRLYEASYIHEHRLGSNFCEKCQDTIGTCSKSCDELGCEKDKLVLRKRLYLPESPSTDINIEHAPSVHFGRFGSANSVMKSGVDRDRIGKDDGVIAFEMEGAGVWDELPTMVIKAVCDYADSHKNKEWQEYAAATAAACVKAFLGEWIMPDQLPHQG